MHRNSSKWPLVDGPATYDFTTTLEGPCPPHYVIMEVCWDGLWILSFGLPQFHGHGSRLMCEVALTWAAKLLLE